MPRFPALRRQRGYYGRRPAVRSGGYKRFSRRGPRRAPVRGRVHALRIMSNPVPAYTHNICAPRYFTNLEWGFAGQTTPSTGLQFSVLGNSVQVPGNTSNSFASVGTIFPATHALSVLQPVGLAALAGLYNQIRVWESTITVSVLPGYPYVVSGHLVDYALPGASQVVVFPTSTEEALSDAQLAQSLPYSTIKICNANGSQKDNTIIKRMDTRTMYGISDAQMESDPNYYALYGQTPANSWWWNVVIARFTGGDGSVQIQDIVVRVNYKCEFFDPKGSEADT